MLLQFSNSTANLIINSKVVLQIPYLELNETLKIKAIATISKKISVV